MDHGSLDKIPSRLNSVRLVSFDHGTHGCDFVGDPKNDGFEGKPILRGNVFLAKKNTPPRGKPLKNWARLSILGDLETRPRRPTVSVPLPHLQHPSGSPSHPPGPPSSENAGSPFLAG